MVLFVILGLLSLMTGLSGIMKITLQEPVAGFLAKAGYANGFIVFIGVSELLAAIGLWLARFRNLALLGLMLIMPGAIATHIGAGEPLSAAGGAIGALVFVLAALLLNSPKELKALFLGSPS